MQDLTYSIDEAVFAKFPHYVRAVVLAYDVQNGGSPPELVALLRAEEESLRRRLTPETLIEYPRIKSWREAFRSLGIKPADYRPSIEAMTRRVLRGDSLPSINALVDIGNLISLRYLVPAGGHAIDHLRDDIRLGVADGSENFTSFESSEVEHPPAGEIVFLEGKTVLTRRWVWRQSNHTLTLPETRAIEFNIDVLPPVPSGEMRTICADLMTLVEEYCGGRMRAEVLDAGHPRISLAEG